MISLNLTAMKTEEVILKDYLESNASESLAEKINNGVRIEKDGKTLTNKKTIATFYNYAYEEAKKQAEKGSQFACLHHDTVFSWAIHYFEEDSIEGTLYNEDGTEYRPVKPAMPKITAAKPAANSSNLPKVSKISIFDMMDEQKLDDFKLDAQETEPAKIKEPKPEESEPVQTPNRSRFYVPPDDDEKPEPEDEPEIKKTPATAEQIPNPSNLVQIK